MSIVAAVKKAVELGGDHWRFELSGAEQDAHYLNWSAAEKSAWKDARRMECAERYVEIRRLYQNMPVFDI